MDEEQAREGLTNGTFTAYGPASTRLYATLDGEHTVAIKSVAQLDNYAGRLSHIHTGNNIQIRKA